MTLSGDFTITPEWAHALMGALVNPKSIRPRRSDVRARVLREWVTLTIGEAEPRNMLPGSQCGGLWVSPGKPWWSLVVADKAPAWVFAELRRLGVPVPE